MGIKRIWLDFETYSPCNLKKRGAYAYASHPDTEMMRMGYAVDNQKPKIYVHNLLHGKLNTRPAWTYEKIEIYAWNAAFEQAIWTKTLKWSDKNITWIDVQASAMALGLPRDLLSATSVLNFKRDIAKDTRGKKLIDKYCKPSNSTGRRIYPSANELREIDEYCTQDVIACRAVWTVLPRHLSEVEQMVWQVHNRINLKGIPIDIDLCERANKRVGEVKEYLAKQYKRLTGLDSTHHTQIKNWLCDNGIEVTNAKKETLNLILKDENTPKLVKNVILLRSLMMKTPLAKYQSMLDMQVNGRLYGSHIYHGALHGRWASSGVQLQNIPRTKCIASGDKTEYKTKVLTVDIDKYLSNPVMTPNPIRDVDILISCIRPIITAPAGRLLTVDYSQIEARVLAWLAGEHDLVMDFAKSEPVYEKQASAVFNKPVKNITSEERTIGKTLVLACGYGMGAKRFRDTLETMYKIDISVQDAQSYVDLWRQNNPKITKYWKIINTMMVQACENPNVTYTTKDKRVSVRKIEDYLMLKLPSKRIIAFPKAEVLPDEEYNSKSIKWQARDSVTSKWIEQRGYPGKMVEYVVSGTARDIMAWAMVRLDKAGYTPSFHVHDEVVIEINKPSDIEPIVNRMKHVPTWAKGLPIDVEYGVSKRYVK